VRDDPECRSPPPSRGGSREIGDGGTISSRGPELTIGGLRRGFLLGLPFALNSCIYGIVFGVLASDAGLSLIEATLMSALMYSGTAQIAALQVGVSVAHMVPLTVTIVMMNARYLLMGAAVRHIYSGLPPGTLALTLWSMGDTSWAMALRENAAGRSDAGIMIGSGTILITFWTLATAVGCLAGNAIAADPKKLGLDFMIAAVCTASAAAMWGKRPESGRRSETAAVLSAIAAAVITQWMLSGAWYIVVAGIVGAVVGGLGHARAP